MRNFIVFFRIQPQLRAHANRLLKGHACVDTPSALGPLGSVNACNSGACASPILGITLLRRDYGIICARCGEVKSSHPYYRRCPVVRLYCRAFSCSVSWLDKDTWLQVLCISSLLAAISYRPLPVDRHLLSAGFLFQSSQDFCVMGKNGNHSQFYVYVMTPSLEF